MIPKNDKFHKRIGELYVPKDEDEKKVFEYLLYTEANSLGNLVSDQTIKVLYDGKSYEFKSNHIINELKRRRRNNGFQGWRYCKNSWWG